MTNDELFRAVCDMLQAGHHMVEKHLSIDTLNRLFQKNIRSEPGLRTDAPVLDSSNVTVTLENWDIEQLKKLGSRKESRLPHREDLPVVVIRYRGQIRLLDGGSRIFKWTVEGRVGNHPTYVLDIRDA